MPNNRIPNPSRQSSQSGGRMVRKRSPVFPGPMLDQTLIDLLAKADVPLSAYDLAERIRERGRHMAVMSIYRALDRLCATGAIEKVETLSAYRVKDIPKAILTICLSCGRTRPLSAPELHEQLEHAVRNAGFSPRSITIEARGVCAQCGM